MVGLMDRSSCLCVFSMALALALWRNKVLGIGVSLVVFLASLISIALGEVKVNPGVLSACIHRDDRKKSLAGPFHFLGTGAPRPGDLRRSVSIYRDESITGQKGSVLEHVERSFG